MTAAPGAAALPSGYELREVERYAEPGFSRLFDEVLQREAAYIDPAGLLPAAERARLRAGRAGWRYPDRLRLGVFADGELVAFSFGWQTGPDRFYMASSGVAPGHRRRGIYAALLDAVLAAARARDLDLVWSRHIATNNAVLVAKLTRGFVICGMEIEPMLGTVVHLRRDLRPPIRELVDARAGMRRPRGRVADRWLNPPGA